MLVGFGVGYSWGATLSPVGIAGQLMKRILLSVPHMGGSRTNLRQPGLRDQLAFHRGPQPRPPSSANSRAASGCPPSRWPAEPPPSTWVCACSESAPATKCSAPPSPSPPAANPIRYLGAEPVFVDSDYATWNLDPEVLDPRSGRRAAAGSPAPSWSLHLYGQSADMDPILDACASTASPVLEDAAEALGDTYKGRPAGTLGDVAASLLQRQQDHHHHRRRHARLAATRPGSRRPASGPSRPAIPASPTNTPSSATTTA